MKVYMDEALKQLAKEYSHSSIGFKQALIRRAYEVIADALDKEYYKREDLITINYSEICDWLNWPDFQDSGLLEQAITMAVNQALWVYFN